MPRRRKPGRPKGATKKRSGSDLVNHPAHYTAGRFETIDVIEDVIPHYNAVEGHLAAEVIRYVVRAPLKSNKVVDLQKAQWYLNRLVAKQKG